MTYDVGHLLRGLTCRLSVFRDEGFSLPFQLTPSRLASAFTTRHLYPAESGVGPIPASPTLGCATRVLLFRSGVQPACPFSLVSAAHQAPAPPPFIWRSLGPLSVDIFQHIEKVAPAQK